jgi:hypothetical protein
MKFKDDEKEKMEQFIESIKVEKGKIECQLEGKTVQLEEAIKQAHE